MKKDKRKNLAMIAVATAILVAVNLGVWQAAQQGAIAPIENNVLWMAFVALNVVSLVWSISLLGLQPLVVAVSYLAGGFLAFKGVQGMNGVNIAEITTAGATYGAFGSLAVGNCTTKVRLAFFNKGQVPFIFIIVALLVFDAVLNSGISSADGSVILNAVVFPFVLAGVIVGLIWSILNRYGIGQKVDLSHHEIAAEHPEMVEDADGTEELLTLKIQIPDQAEEEVQSDAIAAVVEEAEVAEKTEIPEVEPVKPVVAHKAEEEEFFPLEIDKDDDFILQEETYDSAEVASDMVDVDEDHYTLHAFDASLYASGADDSGHGGVLVEEPVVAISLDLDEDVEVATQPEPTPVAEVKKSKPESKQADPAPKKAAKSDDWLSGHLDLLSKLK